MEPSFCYILQEIFIIKVIMMEITNVLITKKYTFSRCVICKCVFGEDDRNPNSDKHLIPEFLGGEFKIGLLCKICNNEFGGGFEDRVAQSFLGKFHANKYKIQGKSRRVPNSPLVGDYQYGDKKIFLTPEYNVKTHYSLECIKNDENGIVFSGHIDASDLESSKNQVVTSVIRAFKKQGKIIDKKAIYEYVSKIIDNSVINVEESPTLHSQISIDFNDLELLFLKIAYETLCIHFGELIVNDDFFNPWRASLKTQKLDEAFIYQYDNFFNRFKPIANAYSTQNIINFEEFEQGNTRDNILIILSDEVVFVRCLRIWIKFKTNQNLPICLYEHSVSDSKLRFYDSDRFIVRLLNRNILTD